MLVKKFNVLLLVIIFVLFVFVGTLGVFVFHLLQHTPFYSSSLSHTYYTQAVVNLYRQQFEHQVFEVEDGAWVLVEIEKDLNHTDIVHISERQDGRWVPVDTLDFGEDVHVSDVFLVSGDTLFVDAIIGDWDAYSERDSFVFVFERAADKSGWVETDRIKSGENSFGWGVAAESETLVVSGGLDVNIFKKQPNGWILSDRILLPFGIVSSSFYFLSLSGDTLAVGVGGGSIIIFEEQGEEWVQTARIDGSAYGFDEDDWFGQSIALSGDTLAVSSYLKYDYGLFNEVLARILGQDDHYDNVVYVFEKHDGVWSLADDGDIVVGRGVNPYFGSKVFLIQDILMVLLPDHYFSTPFTGGTLQLFYRRNGVWDLIGQIPNFGYILNGAGGWFGENVFPVSGYSAALYATVYRSTLESFIENAVFSAISKYRLEASDFEVGFDPYVNLFNVVEPFDSNTAVIYFKDSDSANKVSVSTEDVGYVFVIDVDKDEVMFHSAFSELVGQKASEVTGPDGSFVVRDVIIPEATEDGAWVEYMFTDPADGKAKRKRSFVVRKGFLIFGVELYDE